MAHRGQEMQTDHSKGTTLDRSTVARLKCSVWRHGQVECAPWNVIQDAGKERLMRSHQGHIEMPSCRACTLPYLMWPQGFQNIVSMAFKSRSQVRRQIPPPRWNALEGKSRASAWMEPHRAPVHRQVWDPRPRLASRLHFDGELEASTSSPGVQS